jgi:hypothetical protein
VLQRFLLFFNSLSAVAHLVSFADRPPTCAVKTAHVPTSTSDVGTFYFPNNSSQQPLTYPPASVQDGARVSLSLPAFDQGDAGTHLHACRSTPTSIKTTYSSNNLPARSRLFKMTRTSFYIAVTIRPEAVSLQQHNPPACPCLLKTTRANSQL